MDASRVFGRLAAGIERERAALGVARVPGAAATEARFAEEVWTSTALAGSPLTLPDVGELLRRGVARGDHRLDAYVLVADYAAAARYVRSAPDVGPRRPYLRSEEIVDLHARATRRSTDDRPGVWRSTTLAPFPSGMVAPPAWLVPREIAAFVERLFAGPPAGTPGILWVAAAHARFERIHPFATANGRVGRLVANLLLRRLGLPQLVIPGRDAAQYLAALRRADARDPWPLATMFAKSVLTGLMRLRAAQLDDGELVPLAQLVAPDERPALYKAAQRGRLHAVRRGGTLLSTQTWVDEYRASSPGPRRDAQKGLR